MLKTPSTSTKIRFQDCDPFNHLNNSKYIDYFINAREDQVNEHYKLDIFEMAKTQGIAWVVASNQIAYISPAFTMETVVIQSHLFAFSEKSLSVEMSMWNEKLTKLKSLFWVKFIHFDIKNQVSLKHTPELMSLFQQVIVPVDQNVFEERYKQVISNPATLLNPSNF